MTKLNYLLFFLFPLLISCSDDENLIKRKIEMRVGKTYKLDHSIISIIKKPNDFVASLTNGVILGEHMGETTLSVQTEDAIIQYTITVEPNTTLFRDLTDCLGQTKKYLYKEFGEPSEIYYDKASRRTSYIFNFPEVEQSFTFYISDSKKKITTAYIRFYLHDKNLFLIYDHFKERYKLLYSYGFDEFFATANDEESSTYQIRRTILYMYNKFNEFDTKNEITIKYSFSEH